MEDFPLQKHDSYDALERKRVEIEIASAVSDNQVSTANDIADKFGLDVMDAIRLLSSDEFLETVTLFTNAKLTLLWHGEAINKLRDILRTGDNKEKIAAINTLGKIKGALKSGVELNLNLERLLDEAHEKQVTKVTLESDDDVTDLFPDEKGTYGKKGRSQ
jgi:hypothetical protein